MNKSKTRSFFKETQTMLSIDLRRMFTSLTFYIFVGIAFVMPILILVMTSMMDGTVSVNPQTGAETVIEGFDNVWQAIGATSKDNTMMNMSITAMCNINMLFFFVPLFVCLFISDDFRSGYSKNLFTSRPQKSDYIASKTIIGFVVGAVMLVAFFVGAMLGGVFAGLPFTLDGANAFNVVLCMLSKILLTAMFSAVSVLAGCFAKQRAWLSIILSFAFSMLFFTMIPMITPLDATLLHLLLCVAGAAMFAVGIGFASNAVLKKQDLI